MKKIKPQLGTMKEQKHLCVLALRGFSLNLTPVTRSTLTTRSAAAPADHHSWETEAEPPGWHVTSCLPPTTPRSFSLTCNCPPRGSKHLLLPQAGTRGWCVCLVTTTHTSYTSKPNCILLSAKNKLDNLRPSSGYDSYVQQGLMITSELA